MIFRSLCVLLLATLLLLANFQLGYTAELTVKPTHPPLRHTTEPELELELQSEHLDVNNLRKRTWSGSSWNLSDLLKKVDSVFDAFKNKKDSKIWDWTVHFLEGTSDIVTFNNYQYKYFCKKETWQQAEKNCITWGGHLVSIHNEYENYLVKKLADNGATTWIGFSDALREGIWKWTDGSDCNFNKWNSNQPDNYQNCEDCAATNWQSSGKWNDLSCSTKLPYICKRAVGQCHWDNGDMDAPEPVVNKEVTEENVVLSIQMPQKENQKVKYAVSFNPIDTDSMCPDNKCISEDQIDLSNWAEISDRCDDIFELHLSLKEFIEYANPEVINLGDNMVKLKVTLYMAYFDPTNGGPCDITKFQSEIEFQTTICPDVSHDDLLFPPDYTSVTVNEEGKLNMDLLVRPRTPEAYCTSFAYASHSNNIPFNIHYSEVECAQDRVSCAYRLNIVAQTVLDDYSGTLTVSFKFFNGYFLVDTTFDLQLQYKLVEEPQAVVDVISTSSSIMNQDYNVEKHVITPFERVYLLTKTDETLALPDASIEYEDVFFCCSRDSNPIPPYILGTDQKGCTVRDDRTMSYWAQLVKDGQLQSKLDAKFEDLGPLVRDKLALSFSASDLGMTDRMCSIHVRTRLETENQQMRRSLVSKEDAPHHMDSSAVVTVKGCSYLANEEKCGSAGASVCEWKREAGMCISKRKMDNTSGSMQLGSNHVLMALALCFAFIVLFV